MGKKSDPVQPKAPDPAATAAAQKDTNIASAIAQANLNRIDQVTPQGALKYIQQTNEDGTPATNADGTPRYTQTQTLSPDEQKKYDLANQVATSLSGLATSNISRVQDAQATPFTYDGMSPVTSNVKAGALQGLAPGGGLSGIGDAGGLSGIGDAGGIQKGLDYSGLTKLPGTDDFSGDARRVADSVYSQAASRLDPRFQQSDSDMAAKLAAQGISNNSDAYRREVDNAGRTKNDAYNQAAYSAQQAGSAEQSRIFGLALGARQQGKSEADTQGTFANEAQRQQFDQQAARTAMANQNQSTLFDQQAARTTVANQNQSTLFDQGAKVAAVANTNQGQEFNQGAANAALSNSARQQQIQEATYLRNLPLNDIAALLGTGPGVAQPDFNPVAQVGVAAPDYAGMVQNNYGTAMNTYNSQQAAKAQMMGQIFGTVGTLGAAAIKSDVRLKENIKRIGTLASGIATYAFSYIGDRAQQFGVMAQEVLGILPQAVSVGSDGYLRVDYGKVF